MKRTISLICSLVMALQLMLTAIPVWAEGEEGTKYAVPENPSVTYNLNIDWKFRKATNGALALKDASDAIKDSSNRQFYDVDYDDSDWETVSVPHPINATDSFDDAISNAGERGLYRGFMFYRKHITVPETDAGKKFFIEFESVRNSVYLYVNGEMAGYYEAGVVATGYDITEYLKPGQDNVIAIATDNAASRGRTDFTTTETINDGTHTPGDLSGSGYEWNTNEFNETQGGITGNVNLYAKSQIYQTLPLYDNLKTTGNYIYASDYDLRDVNNSKAKINVKAEIRNETDADKDITLQVDVVKMDGTLAATFSKSGNIAKASDAGTAFKSVVPADAYTETPEATNANTVDVSYITASLDMENLRLWSPDDPYMYTVYTYLKDEQGNILDAQEKATGFREVIYDYNGTDGGFKINGKPIFLKGYAQRSTNEWAAIGVANDWLSDYDMSLVRESNSNFIRWMHVAPKPATIRSTDKYGVVSVCPAGDKEKYEAGRQWDQRMEAMRSAIIYYRNSPSVIFWEAGNGDIPAENMQEMTDIKQKLDPNGFRFMGCRTISSEDQVKAAEYIGTMLFRNAGPAQNAMKAAGKYIPIMETEYSRGESPRRVWDDFSPYFAPNYKGETLYDYVNKYTTGQEGASAGDIDTWDLTQEDFVRRNVGDYADYYESRVNGGKGTTYTDSKGNSFNVTQNVAAALMIWADSNQHGRNAITENARSSGKVDAVRVKKEAFYAMQAAQSDEPAVHIVGHWNYPKKTDDNYWYWEKKNAGTFWENSTKAQRDPSKKTVYVIGSGDVKKVELWINDTLADTCTKPESNYIYSFPNTDVTQSGKVVAKAYNARDEIIAEDEIKTTGEPERIELSPVTGPEGFLADGSDIMYFDISVVDKDGNVCPLSYDKISLRLSGEGTLMGGYNSGADANSYTQEDEQTIYAECGLNRVFVRSTRTAGTITLSASLEGKTPTEASVTSTDLQIDNGITTHKQQALKAGEKPPVIQQTVAELKPLGNVFTADFDEENGNTYVAKDEVVEKDIYTVNVNGTKVTFTDDAYQAGGAIWAEAEPVLAALKAAGLNITYSYNESAKTLTVNGDNIVIKAVVDDPDLLVTRTGSSEERVGPMNGAPLISDKGIFVMDLSTMFNLLGVSISSNAETKVMDIVYSSTNTQSALYSNDDSAVSADDNTQDNPSKCVKITATYDDNGVLQSVTTEEADISDAYPETNGNTKIMYWKSLSSMEPVNAENAGPVITPVPWSQTDITEYDTVAVLTDCNEAIADCTLSEDTSPDGTKYITTNDDGVDDKGNSKWKEVKVASLPDDSKADIMWSADVRFNNNGSSIIPRNKANNYGTCVIRHDDNNTPKLAIQTGGSSFTHYETIDPKAWYHIVLIGRYSAPDARTDLILYKYEDGKKVLVKRYDNVNQRNLSAGNKNGAQYWCAGGGISVDNAQITMLGADQLWVESEKGSISAGGIMQFTYKATRANSSITAPAVKWSLYDTDNAEVLNDENISITDGGLLSISADAESKLINVRATAQIKEGKEIYSSKKIKVKAVDRSSDTYDAVTVTADKDTVRVGEPVQLSAVTTLNGAAVTPGEGDLIWKVYNEAGLRETGNKNISISENGVLSVTADVLPQKITAKAVNKSGSISGGCIIEILPANMNYDNEDTYTDTYVSANACEEAVTGLLLNEGSWDGSGYYSVTNGYDFTGFPSNTTEDVIYSADMQFANDNSGWTIFSNDRGKLGLQLSSSGNTLNALGASNKVVGSLTIDKKAWYNVQVMCSAGNPNNYAICSVYKYENGKRVHPSTGEENKPYNLTVSLRNLAESSANHIGISAGTNVDNVLNFKVAPDALTLTAGASTVLAGGSVQASTTASRKGIDFPHLNNSLIKYEVYDAENKFPLEDDKIKIDTNGKLTVDAMADPQDIYIRVSSVSGGMNDSKKITIKSSDIFEVTKAGFNEDYSVLKKLDVTKNFYYKDDVSFISAVYASDGSMKALAMRKMYGDQLNEGENSVALNMQLPADFSKTNDKLNVFVITKLSSVKEADTEFTATVSNGKTAFSNLPAFDSSSSVVILALKPNAAASDVTNSDIAYFNQISSDKLVENPVISVSLESGSVIKLSGKINGVQVIAEEILE